MNQFTNQILMQMVMDTIRVVMLVYALGIIILVVEGMNRLEKLIGKLIVRGCKAMWQLVKKLFSRSEIAITAEEQSEV